MDLFCRSTYCKLIKVHQAGVGKNEETCCIKQRIVKCDCLFKSVVVFRKKRGSEKEIFPVCPPSWWLSWCEKVM